MQRVTCRVLGTILIVVALSQSAWAQASQKWVVSWAASAQGPYPVGNVSAQPDQRFAFPDPAAGARDQTMRLIVRPSIWGQQMRIRLSNVFGTRPVSFDGIHVGLQLGGPALAKGTNRPITFGGKESVTVPPGLMSKICWVSLALILPPMENVIPEFALKMHPTPAHNLTLVGMLELIDTVNVVPAQ